MPVGDTAVVAAQVVVADEPVASFEGREGTLRADEDVVGAAEVARDRAADAKLARLRRRGEEDEAHRGDEDPARQGSRPNRPVAKLLEDEPHHGGSAWTLLPLDWTTGFSGRRPRRGRGRRSRSADAAGAAEAVLRARRAEAARRVAVRRAVIGVPARARPARLAAAARERVDRVRRGACPRRRHEAEAEPYGRRRGDVAQEAPPRARALEADGFHRITSLRPARRSADACVVRR